MRNISLDCPHSPSHRGHNQLMHSKHNSAFGSLTRRQTSLTYSLYRQGATDGKIRGRMYKSPVKQPNFFFFFFQKRTRLRRASREESRLSTFSLERHALRGGGSKEHINPRVTYNLCSLASIGHTISLPRLSFLSLLHQSTMILLSSRPGADRAQRDPRHC